MLISYKRGQTGVVLRVKILNSSVSTGAGLTGLTSASSGLRIGTIADNEATTTAYTAGGSTIETITTLGTFATPTSTKCRFKEIDATSHPGLYEIQLDNTRYAVTSAKSLIVSISGAANCAETDVCIPLTDTNPYDAVQGGMTALPAFAAGANGGLPVLSTSATTLAYTVSTVTTLTNLPTITANWLTAAGIAADAITAAKIADGAIDAATFAASAINAAAIATNAIGAAQLATDAVTEIQSGLATASALSSVATNVTTIKASTDNLPSDPADESLIIAATTAIMTRLGAPTGASVSVDIAAVKSDTAAVKAKTDQFVFTIAGQVDANALSGGGSGLDAAGVRAAIGMASANMDTQLDTILAASGSGSGSISYTVTINDDMATPLDGAEVWVSTDVGGSNVIAGTLNTNASGQVTFLLDAGSYFLWVSHSGYNRDNPTAITV